MVGPPGLKGGIGPAIETTSTGFVTAGVVQEMTASNANAKTKGTTDFANRFLCTVIHYLQIGRSVQTRSRAALGEGVLLSQLRALQVRKSLHRTGLDPTARLETRR